MEREEVVGLGAANVSAPELAYRSVLIVTYGRSGSTLLQGLLNSMPGCLVRGENYNFCYGLYLSYQSLLMSKAEQGWEVAMSATNPWFGAPKLSPESFVQDAAILVRKQLLADVDPKTVSCLGFKEVRYPELTSMGRELPKYLDFLGKLFPETAFLFLTRDLASVTKSGWWKNAKPENVRRDLGRFEEVVRIWARGRTNVFFVDYQDLAGHSARVGELFAFLGAPYDRSVVDGVLAIPHSSWPATAAVSAGTTGEPAPAMAIPAATAVDAPGRRAWVKVDFRAKALARVWVVDPLPECPAAGKFATVGGVLLTSKEMPEGVSMMLRTGDQLSEVQWHLPSPGVGGAFPNDPGAAAARFKLKLSAEHSDSEIVLKAPNGQVWLVANLKFFPEGREDR